MSTWRAALTTVLGAILAATPLALWIAWTATVLLIVVAVAIASAGLLVLLTPRTLEQAPPARDGAALPDEFIAEVQRLFPLTYHHSLRETARFRRAMEKLSRMISASRAAPSP